MILLLLILTSLFALICFGSVRLLDNKLDRKPDKKWQEIIYFFVIFVVMVLIVQTALFCSITHNANPEYLDFGRFFKDTQMLSLFYIAPVFFISYLLFPFKAIKKSKTSLGILSIPTILTLIAVGFLTVIEVLHAFSNM
jgi:heme/copper-type cytochrome/quinol oxidase subunit 2